MRKILYMALAVLLTVTACQSEVDSTVKTKVRFTARNESSTKTVLNNISVLWQSNDAITVFSADGASAVATAKPYSANTCATFDVTIQNSDTYYAVYPHSAHASVSGGVISVNIPQEQSGLFKDVNFTVAKATQDNELNFKHIAGYIEFTVDKPGIVEIYGANGDVLTGDVKVTGFDNYIPVYTVQNGKTKVTVDVKSSGTYHVALLPDAELNTFSFTLTDGTSVSTAFSSNSMKMQRGKLYSLGNVTDRLIPDGHFGATVEDFILEEFPYNF